MKLLDFLFPKWTLFQQATGEWNIKVTTDLFGNYKETKFCRFEIMFSKKLKKYKLKISGYKPKEHKLYDAYSNYLIQLNMANSIIKS